MVTFSPKLKLHNIVASPHALSSLSRIAYIFNLSDDLYVESFGSTVTIMTQSVTDIIAVVTVNVVAVSLPINY